jgi:outer membrane protein assembly factor BamD
MIFRTSLYTSVILLSIFLSSCSSTKTAVLTRTQECKIQLDEAQKEFDDENYFASREKLHRMQRGCSGTGYMAEAQFMLAESYKMDEEWLDARAEYSLYAQQFPSADNTPKAVYLKGYCASKAPWKKGRDASLNRMALQDVNEYLEKFPNNNYQDSALLIQNEIIERMAKDFYKIANLYLKMSEPQAAAIYFKEFIHRYPKSILKNNAQKNLIESYVRLDQFEEALRQLETWTTPENKEEAITWKDDIQTAKANLLEKIDDNVEEKQRKRTEIER